MGKTKLINEGRELCGGYDQVVFVPVVYAGTSRAWKSYLRNTQASLGISEFFRFGLGCIPFCSLTSGPTLVRCV